MANTFTLTAAARNAACNAIVDLVDINSGSPDGTQGFVSIQTTASAELVAIGLGSPAFGAAAAGVAQITATVTGTATASGTAGRFELQDKTAVEIANGDVTLASASPRGVMTLTNTSLNTGDRVQLTAMSVTVPAT